MCSSLPQFRDGETAASRGQNQDLKPNHWTSEPTLLIFKINLYVNWSPLKSKLECKWIQKNYVEQLFKHFYGSTNILNNKSQ